MNDQELLNYFRTGGDLSLLSDADYERLKSIAPPVQSPLQGTMLAPPPVVRGQGMTGEVAGQLINAGTHGLEAAAGLLPGTAPARMAIAALSGGLGGSIRGLAGGEDPVEAGTQGGASNALLEGGAAALQHIIPRTTLPLALWLGGAHKGDATIGEMVQSFLRPFEKKGTAITVGNARAAKEARAPINESLASLETSIPGEPLSTRALAGSTRQLRSEAGNVPYPRDARRAMRSAEQRLVSQHVQEGSGVPVQRTRLRRTPPQAAPNPYTTTMNPGGAPTRTPAPPTGLQTSPGTALAPRSTALGPARTPGLTTDPAPAPTMRSVGRGATPAAQAPSAANSTVTVPNVGVKPGSVSLAPAGMDRLKTVREGYELGRNLKHDAKAVIEARQGKQFMTKAEQAPEQAKLAINDRIDEILDPYMAQFPSRNQNLFGNALEEKQDINQLLSDLHNQEAISRAVRGGGMITDIGKMGSRGGAASGATKNVFAATGMGTQNPVSGILPLLSMVTLASQPISYSGYKLAQGAKWAPSAERLRELLADLGLAPPGLDIHDDSR